MMLKILKSVPMIPLHQWNAEPLLFSTQDIQCSAVPNNVKLGGTKTCLFQNCNYTYNLSHIMWNCEWQDREDLVTKGHLEGRRNECFKGLADHPIKLHEFRMEQCSGEFHLSQLMVGYNINCNRERCLDVQKSSIRKNTLKMLDL